MCLLAAPWVQLSVGAGNGWPHNALRHHWLMAISCHFRDCTALLVTSLTHVSGAITSVRTFILFVFGDCQYNVDCSVRWQRAPGVMLRKQNIEMTPEDGTGCFYISCSLSIVQ